MTEWININDKKPPYGWMILSYRYFADPKILCVDFGLHMDGIFTSGGVIRDVTHWMPLPKPPEERCPN